VSREPGWLGLAGVFGLDAWPVKRSTLRTVHTGTVPSTSDNAWSTD